MKELRPLLGPVVVIALVGVAMLWSPFEPHGEPEGADMPLTAEPTWDDADWAVLEEKVRWAAGLRLDTLPLGSAMAAIGRTFVGTPYVPHTLEVEGPERLVIDFQGLDCVTFVENVFALARFVRGGGAGRLADRGRAEAAYETLLREIRYRDGRIAGYPSRLHYFSDWIGHNDARGLVEDVTAALGGVPETEPVDFMTTHASAYRQLADAGNVAAVRAAEERLSASSRHWLPERSIAAAALRIRDGDVIAATSTVPGLDVAHTGLALWVDGALHLLHAPLVGDSVEISAVPLADRILSMEGQDGIMVARPLDARFPDTSPPDTGPRDAEPQDARPQDGPRDAGSRGR